MTRRLIFLATWLVLVSPTLGEEKYSFSVEVQTGDVIEVSGQEVFSVDASKISAQMKELLGGPHTSRTEQRLTIVKAENGRAETVDGQVTRRETDTGESGLSKLSPYLFQLHQASKEKEPEPKPEPKPKPKPAIIRYERIGGNYNSRLLDGDLTPDVAKALGLSRPDPLWERLLPSEPLEVGESQPIEYVGSFSLSDQSPKEMADEGEVVIDKPPTVKLEKVDGSQGTRIAFLSISYALHSKEAMEIPDQEPEPLLTESYTASVIYDLDQKRISQIEEKVRGSTPGKINGEPVLIQGEGVKVIRFRKK